MIGIATALLMNLRFGIKVQHYGLAILSALLGRIVSLRQISFHVCPEFPIFGAPIFGLALYVWAFIIFTCSMLACALLLIIYGYSKHHQSHRHWGLFEKIAFSLVVLIALSNGINTLIDCGLSSCIE
jgi:hypothetical protein